MNNWREQLNRLAVEFWCGVGDLSELSAWADTANAEMGEVHPDVWDIYASPKAEQANRLLLKIAKEVNGFSPESFSAKPFAINALKKALTLFLSKELSVQELCKLVDSLDTVLVIGLPMEGGIYDQPPRSSLSPDLPWLGNLWNCCDWCDDGWTFENSQALVAEAQRVLAMLANPSFNTDWRDKTAPAG
jgi:hypothetical protein